MAIQPVARRKVGVTVVVIGVAVPSVVAPRNIEYPERQRVSTYPEVETITLPGLTSISVHPAIAFAELVDMGGIVCITSEVLATTTGIVRNVRAMNIANLTIFMF